MAWRRAFIYREAMLALTERHSVILPFSREAAKQRNGLAATCSMAWRRAFIYREAILALTERHSATPSKRLR